MSTGRTVSDARRWSEVGTELCAAVIAAADDELLAQPVELPGWTRAHVVAHLAANAEALGNLVQWAVTGVPTPMYASTQARAAGIEAGAQRSAAELAEWFSRSAAELSAAMDRLTDEQWQHRIRTAQGRDAPATDIPWMRSREVCVHAVDLGVGIEFADLPEDFLHALADDILVKRGLLAPPLVHGSLADRVAYLAGRPSAVTGADGGPAEPLPPWL